MSQKKDIENLIEDLEEEHAVGGLNEKLKERNSDKVKASDKIKDLRISNGRKDSYVLKPGEKFKCEMTLEKDEIDEGKLIISNKKSFSDLAEVVIYSKDVSKEGEKSQAIFFSWDSVILDPSRYNISLEVDGEKIIQGITVQVLEGEKNKGKWIVLRDPRSDADFPQGKFYVFGDTDDIVKKYKKGKLSVPVLMSDNLIDLQELKGEYTKGQIIGSE